jgi:hypothetical protein
MKGHTGKKAVNRHQTQSKASAGAQERAIERKERQRGAKEVREARIPVEADRPCPACNGSGHYDNTGSPRCASCSGTGRYDNTAEGAATHWRLLAKKERERLSWDKYLLPAIAEERARSYENTALAIEKSAVTGIDHCSCHLIPRTQCAERAMAVRRAEARR